MEFYNNEYYAWGYRLKPWFTFRDEERTWVLHRLYESRVLTSEEISPYLNDVTYNNVSNVLYPFAAYFVLNKAIFPLVPKFLSQRVTPARAKYLTVVAVIASLPFWFNYNPLYTNMWRHRERLLETAYKRIGLNIMDLNTVLPRWRTTFDIHRMIRKNYHQRNSSLAGILYPTEENAEPLVDFKTWAKPKKVGKITK